MMQMLEGLVRVSTLALAMMSLQVHAEFSNQGSADSCGTVKVDCLTHKITIGSLPEKTIDCGRNGTTPTTKGKVGGPHHGDIVKDGVEIQAPGMGQDGGGKVFHTWEQNGQATNTLPTGSDTTKGCVAVDLDTLNMLKQCMGAPLEIVGNGDSRGSSALPGAAPYQDTNHAPGAEIQR